MVFDVDASSCGSNSTPGNDAAVKAVRGKNSKYTNTKQSHHLPVSVSESTGSGSNTTGGNHTSVTGTTSVVTFDMTNKSSSNSIQNDIETCYMKQRSTTSGSNKSNSDYQSESDDDDEAEEDTSDIDEDTSGNVLEAGKNDDENNPLLEMQKYAAIENKLVYRWRRIVVFSILLFGIIIGIITYITLNSEQSSDATSGFTLFANQINDSLQFRIKVIFEANRGLSREITTSAKDHNGRFPYHSIQYFEAKAYEARKRAALETVTYAPIVIDEVEWINFTQSIRYVWLNESKVIYDVLQPGQNRTLEPNPLPLSPVIWDYSDENDILERTLVPRKGRRGNFVPSFQISPPPIYLETNEMDTKHIFENIDLFTDIIYKNVSLAAVRLRDVVFSKFNPAYSVFVEQIAGNNSKAMKNLKNGTANSYFMNNQRPRTVAAQPVYNRIDELQRIVGYLYSIIAWDYYLVDLVPLGVNGIYVVLRNSCNQSVTYQLFGSEAVWVGEGDLHDPKYNDQHRTVNFTTNYFDAVLTSQIDGHCEIFFDLYPSDQFNSYYENQIPTIFTVVVGLLFASMALIFAVYDNFVQSRNTKVVGAAARSTAIVSSLFPEAVRERLMEQQNNDSKARSFKGFLASDKSDQIAKKDSVFVGKPIADLFPETTIIFADIVNFTAWSSVRDPAQVFTLLEAVYNAFDDIARKRRVFKVETIGDCYVAVCGLPDPSRDHALRMARFAKDCMRKLWSVVKKLESTLGPDTADLTMRMGLHSGPVTAGVLRGERSRFQLFGDTMNTAARMESTGFPDCIQVSQDTADLLIAAGKSSWIKPRDDMVNAKGKGLMQTYFLELNKTGTGSSVGDDSIVDSTDFSDGIRDFSQSYTNLADLSSPTPKYISSKNNRLVEWIAEVLLSLIKEIAVRRDHNKRWKGKAVNESQFKCEIGHSVLSEVKEIIDLPGISTSSEVDTFNPIVDIDLEISEQLHHYLARVASMYPDNPFHNFEHASHVTMSVQKLLARIIAPSDLDRAYEINSLGSDKTYGITSDPLTQFSCIFSAVIHDIDHPGVPNATLIAEKTDIAKKYKNKSIAEQNSVNLAWNLLMNSRYQKLRSAIYSNDVEMKRFRQLVVNSVMATDIADKDQKVFRNARWDRAFHENVIEAEQDSINRKATIVIEHLIQASDVSHTMQHWHIYRKWNERFFEECYKAFVTGHSDVDPSINWYKGEIGFFDFYIIPLAKKLKDCGVFGVSSDEYLNYALRNRNEWEDRGQEVVNEMIERVRAKWPTTPLVVNDNGEVCEKNQVDHDVVANNVPPPGESCLPPMDLGCLPKKHSAQSCTNADGPRRHLRRQIST